MKRAILLSMTLAALLASGCGIPEFEPGVGFHWNRKVNPLRWFVTNAELDFPREDGLLFDPDDPDR
jgi:hypothetical protein